MSSSAASGSAAEAAGPGRSWWLADDGVDQSNRSVASGHTHRHFRSVPFPDLGSAESPSSCLSPPDPSLLPESLVVGVCDVAPWRQKINLREVKMSSKERKREEDRSRRRWDVNRDREVRSTESKLKQFTHVQEANPCDFCLICRCCDAETGPNTGSSCRGGSGGGEADRSTCGTAKSRRYTTRDNR